MATFHISGPGGAEYEVDAPDEATAVGLVSGQPPAAAPSAPAVTFQPTSTADPNKADPGTAADLSAAAANGAAFGFGDRIAAAGDTLVNKARGLAGAGPMEGTSADYAGNLARYRDLLSSGHERHPYASTAAEIAGGAANPLTWALAPELGAAEVAGGAAPAAADAAAAVAPAASSKVAALGKALAEKGAEGARVGAGFGVIQGVAGADDLTNPGDVLGGAALGGAGGALLGGALPIGGHLVGEGYRYAAPWVGSKVDGVRSSASGIVDDLMTPETMQRLQDLGPDAMPVDASRSMQGLGAGVAAIPGQGADDLARALAARNAAQSDRLMVDRNTALGPAMSPTEAEAGFQAKRDALAPLDAQADQVGQFYPPELAAIADRPAVQDALRQAGKTAANEGNPLPTVMLDEQGNVVPGQAADGAALAATRPAVDGAVADYLGSDGTLPTMARLMDERAAAAAPLYEQFRAGEIPTSPELAELLTRPSIRGALPGAERLAQDEGSTIFVRPPRADWELDPYGPIHDPEPPSNMGFGPTDNGVRGRAPTAPSEPEPRNLHQFVRDLGGMTDPTGDAHALGLADIQGLVRRDGLHPDKVREAAAEAGYLGPDTEHAVANTTPADLFDAMSHEEPQFSVRDDGLRQAWQDYRTARTAWDEQGTPNSAAVRGGGSPPRDLDPGGPPAGAAEPPPLQITPQGWDYIKRSLGDRIDTAKRAGAGNDARVATNLKNQLVQHLDAASPVYGMARQAFAGHSDMMDALVAGRDAFRNNLSREQMAADFVALGTDGERDMYRLGAANALREKMAQTGDGKSFVDVVAGNQAMRDKLATLARSPEALADLNSRLDLARHQFTEATRPDVRGWRYALDHLDGQSGKIEGAAGAAIGATRDQLRTSLRTIEPFAQADQGRQAIAGAERAFADGRTVLGDNNLWAEDHARQFGALPIEQQAAHRAGARSDIEQQFGAKRFDLQALKGVLGDSNDFTRGKVGTLFGDDARSAMVKALDREEAFANSHNRITQASNTGQTREGAAYVKDKAPEDIIPKHATGTGLVGNAIERTGRAILRGGLKASGERTRTDLAKLLSMSGPELEAHLARFKAAQGDRAHRAAALSAALAHPLTIRAAVVAPSAGREHGR